MKSFNRYPIAMIVVTMCILVHGEIVARAAAPAAPQTQRVNRGDKGAGFSDSGFASVVASTVSAVVNIASPAAAAGVSDDSREQREAVRQGRAPCLGSGVIATADGYIVTSFHVVEDQSDIRVLLSDNRELKAEIVGIDPKTDIAILKVDATDLPTLTLGRSSSVRVGDMAIAIGDPFGLRQTVTMGIISATGRTGLGILNYEDFIQTDAAINPGSSGGALINLHGELIGIITAGLKEYSGIGFAVPVDIVHAVMDQILAHGRVVRGWLGATVQPLTAATARVFGVTGNLGGALVADVNSGGPASRAGLFVGDIIVDVDGVPLRDDRDLNLVVGMKAPGAVIHLTAIREGRKSQFTVDLSEEPARNRTAEHDVQLQSVDPFGLIVQTLTTDLSEALSLPRQMHGVIVTGVASPSRAATAVTVGDIIVEVNRSPVKTSEEFYARLSSSQTQPILLLIERSGSRLFVVVD